MTLNDFLNLSLTKFSLICFFLYLSIVLINLARKNKKFNKEDLKNSRILAQIYLDQFYIKNKFYTFFLTFIYLFGMVLIFIFLRYLAIGNMVNISPREHLPYKQIIFIYFFLFLFIILYQALLIMLFRKEVNKFYIYLRHFSWFTFYMYDDGLDFKLGDKIFGTLYLTAYRLGSSDENLYPLSGEFPEGWYLYSPDHPQYRFLTENDVEYNIDNKYVQKWIFRVKDLANKSFFIQVFFRLLAHIFRFLLKHTHKLYQPFPYFVLIMVFFIELYNKEFNNIYLVSFFVLLIKTKRDLNTFVKDRSFDDYTLSKYFYANTDNYALQRLYFYSNKNISIEKNSSSAQNYEVYCKLNDIIDSAFNDFKHNHMYKDKKNNGIYRRFLIILGFIFAGYVLLFNTQIQLALPKIILLFPILIMIYSHCKTYYVIEYEEEIFLEDYKYSKIFNIIFWISTVIQAYIYWILILKVQITFSESEVLWDTFITIKKIYSPEEKIQYLYEYFEYYINLNERGNINKDYLRFILRQIDFNPLINENITLKDIQEYIKLLVQEYIEMEYTIYPRMLQAILVSNKIVNPWYLFLKNIVLVGAFMSTIIFAKNIWLLTKTISKPYGIYLITKDIFMTTLHNKLTYVRATEFLTKIFEMFKFPFT